VYTDYLPVRQLIFVYPVHRQAADARLPRMRAVEAPPTMRPGTSARFDRVGVLGHSPDQSQWRATRRVCRGTLSRRDAAGIIPKHRLKIRTRGQGGAPTISGGEMAAPYQRIRIRDSPKRFRWRYIHRVSHEPSPAMVRRV